MLKGPHRIATSALNPFVPRQVMLNSKYTAAADPKIKDKAMWKESRKKKSKSTTSEILENGSKDSKILKLDDGRKGDTRRELVSSIAAFLESSGFHKTLSLFRLEAELESICVDASSYNLEDLFDKFLESSRSHEEAAVNCQMDKDAQKTDASGKDEIDHAKDVSDHMHKKTKMHRKEPDDATITGADEHQLDKCEKKKKKKKKTEATSDSLAVGGSKYTGETPKESESVQEKSTRSANDDNIEKKAHKKRKRLHSEVETPLEENETIAKESTHGKLEGADTNMECETPQEPEESLPGSEQATHCKKRKTEKSCQRLHEDAKVSYQEEEPAGQDAQKESEDNELANGELEKIETETGTASKSKKKDKRSAEPNTTVNAFQRVKIDEIKFADERLQDNSYWALDDTGSGYGAKAQEVLGQVRGRGFRHEKTKKKRGSYRGGQIDLQSHSIKFNYSDEE